MIQFSYQEYGCCEYPMSNSFPIFQVTVWTSCKCLATPTKTIGPDPELQPDPELGLGLGLLDTFNNF